MNRCLRVFSAAGFFAALWTDSGARFLFQTVQSRLVFFFVCTLEQFLAPLQANTRSVGPRARFGSCHLSTAQRTLSQVQISCCRTRSGSGHVCIVSAHGHTVTCKHTLMWNLLGQMWCEHINDRHTNESNQATSSCFSSESVLIINDYFTALESQCFCTFLSLFPWT